MLKKMLAYLQFITPQHLLTRCVGALADSKNLRIKNAFIRFIMKRYPINMKEALDENPDNYASFNDFFIRRLKPSLRPIAHAKEAIASPADGTVSQIGRINKNLLLQAKKYYFDLETLLGGDKALAETFYDGNFATIYLAPHNYHRVHMPLSGTLQHSFYIPGKLFSVNKLTSTIVPNLFSRNERLIAIFDTAAGKMAVILVGALIVGSIKTVWSEQPSQNPSLHIEKGEEMGYFKMGSTVIILFEKDKSSWAANIGHDTDVVMGECLGTIKTI